MYGAWEHRFWKRLSRRSPVPHHSSVMKYLDFELYFSPSNSSMSLT